MDWFAVPLLRRHYNSWLITWCQRRQTFPGFSGTNAHTISRQAPRRGGWETARGTENPTKRLHAAVAVPQEWRAAPRLSGCWLHLRPTCPRPGRLPLTHLAQPLTTALWQAGHDRDELLSWLTAWPRAAYGGVAQGLSSAVVRVVRLPAGRIAGRDGGLIACSSRCIDRGAWRRWRSPTGRWWMLRVPRALSLTGGRTSHP